MKDPHPATADLAYLSAGEATRAMAAGTLTSRALVDALLLRIEALDGPGTDVGLCAIAGLSADAREVADERDRERAAGQMRGPLHGVPVLIKDNVEAVGLPGTAGSTALLGRTARDAPLVTRLRDAGMVLLGSTNLSQWANLRSPRSSSGWSATGGLVGNPWSLDRSAGGSSSGSGAAVAAGYAPLAVGTETDGSIVCPASVNGLVGLKPTVGAVSAACVVPIAASQDTPGPMARTVVDVALLYSVLAGVEDASVTDTPRVAFATNWRTGHPSTDDHAATVVSWLEESGVSVARRELVEPGKSEQEDELAVLVAELYDDLGAYLAGRPGDGVRSVADVMAYEDEHRDVEQPYFGHEFFAMAVASGGRAGEAYAPARQRNLEWAITTCLTPGLDGVDVIVAPAYGPAWKSDLIVGGHPGPASCATMAPAIAGWPILSVPIGLVQGLPVGLAVIARPGCEAAILDVARRVELAVNARAPLSHPSFARPTRG